MRGAATGGSERPGKALFGGTEQAMVMGIGMGMVKRCAALRCDTMGRDGAAAAQPHGELARGPACRRPW